jgi:hypothetical protein
VSAAVGDTVLVTLSGAVINGNTITIFVEAPGCEPTPPTGGAEISVGLYDPNGGPVPAILLGGGEFTAPGRGSVTMAYPSALSNGNDFLLRVSCNGGTLTSSQPFHLDDPSVVPSGVPRFTG